MPLPRSRSEMKSFTDCKETTDIYIYLYRGNGKKNDGKKIFASAIIARCKKSFAPVIYTG